MIKNNSHREKRIISKIFTRLFFAYGKEISVIEDKQSIDFYFNIKNFYSNGKSRDFCLVYEKKTKRYVLYSRSSNKLYSSNCFNEVLHYLKLKNNYR
ncbi:hypothetical protein R4M06_00875 [Brachyspira pilosicoli]|uniref:hypothetical protein n=1 Tax=Brachyspira pilosicoli TaxID=52584 RepID=UPI0030065314